MCLDGSVAADPVGVFEPVGLFVFARDHSEGAVSFAGREFVKANEANVSLRS